MSQRPEPAGKVRRFRQQRGWTLEQLAVECQRAGASSLTDAVLADIENGAPVEPADLQVLAEVFSVSVAALRDDSATEPPRHARRPGAGPVDFFISYSVADEDWATWIAHELETAGYRVMIQAWDFVPGTNFLDFIDRGIRQASAVVAVLSQSYLDSEYGRQEWMAALQTAGNQSGGSQSAKKLLPVRIEDIYPEGLLASITFVDLVGLPDPAQARIRLLDRIRHAMSGRAKPEAQPHYPFQRQQPAAEVPRPVPQPVVATRERHAAIVYPPSVPPDTRPRQELCLLHLAAPRFGRPGTSGPVDRLGVLEAALESGQVPDPDLVVVSGSLTESGALAQFDEVVAFVTGLRALLSLETSRVVVVPGTGDITAAACEAYFADCRADGVEPQPPYFRKWRHFSRMFGQLYGGVNGPVFDANQPWTLFEVPELRVAVAGLNSTVARTHLSGEEPGWLGEDQLAWFAEAASTFERAGYLRVGVVEHAPAAAGTPASGELSDTGALDGILGAHLNLLLHGGPATGGVGELPSGVAVVHPPSSGVQLVHLTRDGLTSWDLSGQGELTRGPSMSRGWHAVDQAFTTDAGPGQLTPARVETALEMSGAQEPDPVQDPVGQLLQRIAEVCEVRHPGCRLRRLPGKLAAVRVTYPDGDVVQQVLIAAHVGEVTEADLAAVVRLLRAAGTDLDAELVHQGAHPGPTLLAEAARHGVRMRSFTEFQGLLDLRRYVAAQSERLHTDRVYPPSQYVPQRFRETVHADSSVRDDVVEELIDLLSADEGRFVLLMGDFGSGKTFAMRKLAMELPVRLPEMTPILIELRKLDKAHSVDGLVAAHLANHGESRIDLRAFRYLLRQGRIVLLFDGFDELATRVSYERAADHLKTLLAAAEGRAKIVVTGRTQHFQSDAQVRTALGERVGLLPHRRVLMLEDFTPAQIGRYLVNRYGQDERAARERLELIGQIKDLGGLSRNPRMLTFVADLDASRLAAVAKAREAISAAGLYQEILTAWLTYERERVRAMAGGPAELSMEQLWMAVTTLALRVWESNEMLLRLDDVVEVAQTLAGLADTPLSPPQATHAVGAASLLVRTEEMFGFIHASVMEWLVAKAIADQVNSGQRPALLSRQQLSQLSVDFLCDLGDSRTLQAWSAQPGEDSVANANALKISKRLRAPATADLRGESLRGEDFCYRDLSGVDLTGADLTDALLIGTKLSRAVLRDARLQRVRLDGANLSEADLSGADLSGARLAEADLRGVEFTGSRWSRAALINVTADAALLGAPELRGAAVAPGQALLTGFTPAGVGVPFGFEDSRLPSPMAYSPDGSLLAVGSGDGGVLICDTDKGLSIRTLVGHEDRVYSVSWGPTTGALVTAAADGTVRFWDPATGEPGAVLTEHAPPVWPLRLSPTGHLVAYGDGAGTVWVRRVPDGRLYRRLPGHAVHIWALAFHPDPGVELLATADNSGEVRIWDLTTDAAARRLDGPDGTAVYGIAFSRDGRLLAAGGWDSVVRVWDVATGARRHELTSHTTTVYSVAFHPAQDVLVSGDTSGSVWRWSIPDRPQRAVSSTTLRSHRASVYHLGFSPDGATLAATYSDGALRIWEAGSGQERHQIPAHRGAVWPPAFRPDSRQIATTGKDGTARLWDTETGQRQYELHGHGRRITGVDFNTAGDLLATSGNDGVVRLWDVRTGRLVKELTGRGDQLISAVFCPARPLLATTSNDGGVHMFHLTTWQSDREFDVGTDHVWASAFDQNGDVLATANDDDSVRLWWRRTGSEKRTLHEHRGRVRFIDFSPDGRTVATGCDDAKVRLFDGDTGKCVATLLGHGDRVYEVRFNADGSLLSSVSNDGTAILWEMPSGRLLRTLGSRRGKLWAGGFSPDGRLLAAAGDDTVIYLWDVATGRHLHSLAGHTRRIWSVRFSPDGTVLASGADDGTTRLWDLSDPDGPRLKLTLLGLPGAWAAVAPDGRYKTDGDLRGEFWHVIGLSRFEVGELDAFLREVHAVPVEEPF